MGELSPANPEIIEYSIDVKDISGLGNAQLRIIDTPGLGSSEGLTQDARILQSLTDYIKGHEELGIGGVIPNVVLIFSKFDDNRIGGQSSSFVKMLRGYEQIRDLYLSKSTESNTSNILFVLSGLLRQTHRVSSNPGPKLDTFKTIIRNFTTFPEPLLLTVVENQARENELEEVDGNFKLPNKELYPQNLIDKMLNVTDQCNDTVGTSIIQSVMSRRREVEVRVRRNGTMAERGENSMQETLGLLAFKDFHVDVTEISGALEAAYGKLDANLRTSYPNCLIFTQRAFQSLNISSMNQVPKGTKAIIELLQKLQLNPGMLALVLETFQIAIPEMPFEQLIGYGYDVFEDGVIPTTPFDFGEVHFSKELGCMVPVSLSVERLNEEVDVLNFYNNEAEYAVRRLEQLNVHHKVDYSLFKGEFLPGENVISSWHPALGLLTATASREFQNVKLILNSDAKLSMRFKEDLELLPPYDLHEMKSVKEWMGIFRNYGTHVVHSVFGGGSIDTVASVRNKELIDSFTREPEKVKRAIQRLPQYTNFSGGNIISENRIDFKMSLTGGDYTFQFLNLLTMDRVNGSEAYKDWQDSLIVSPIMLNSKLRLIPLFEIVRPFNDSLGLVMERATTEYLQGLLVYARPTTSSPRRREEQPVETTPMGFSEVNTSFGDRTIPAHHVSLQNFNKTCSSSGRNTKNRNRFSENNCNPNLETTQHTQQSIRLRNDTVRSPLNLTSLQNPGAEVKPFHAKRSARNAYILVLGLAGSGKSSTVIHLALYSIRESFHKILNFLDLTHLRKYSIDQTKNLALCTYRI